MQKDPSHGYQTGASLKSDLKKIKIGKRPVIILPEDNERLNQENNNGISCGDWQPLSPPPLLFGWIDYCYRVVVEAAEKTDSRMEKLSTAFLATLRTG